MSASDTNRRRVVIDVEKLQRLRDRVRDVVVRAALTDPQGEATRLLDEHLKHLGSYLAD